MREAPNNINAPAPSGKEAAYTQACRDAAYLFKQLEGYELRPEAVAKMETAAESLLHNLRMLRWWGIGPETKGGDS